MKEYKKVKISSDLHEILQKVLIFHPSLNGDINKAVVDNYIEEIVYKKVAEIGSKYARIAKREL